mmetsp:Transcript_57860/g.125614  ORF Transcript_57860/g.125614 Transcript_57860/m.125614 type:complete len:200 (-) Transcript_57860:489-1088(-)
MFTCLPEAVERVCDMPKWYLTSPEPEKSSSGEGVLTPENSQKMCSIGFLTTLARTFSLPRCAMPRMMFSTPSEADESIISSIPGMRTSQPSRPKRLTVEYLDARKASKWSDQARRSRMRSRSSRVNLAASTVSILSRIQFTCSWSQMCMNSKPMVEAYTWRSRAMMSLSFMRARSSAKKPFVAMPVSWISFSMSASVKP